MRIKAERDKSEEEQLQLKKEVEKLLIKRANDAEDKVKQRHELMQIMEELNAENLKLQRKVAFEDNVMKELKIEKKILLRLIANWKALTGFMVFVLVALLFIKCKVTCNGHEKYKKMLPY